MIIGSSFIVFKNKGMIYQDQYDLLQAISSPVYDNDECKFQYIEKLDVRFKNCRLKYKKFILMFGDSHTEDLFNALAPQSSHPFIILINQGTVPYTNLNKGIYIYSTHM